MKVEGEVPSHAVYEMLIRGCTIAMRRVGQGEVPDHLTSNMLKARRRFRDTTRHLLRPTTLLEHAHGEETLPHY